MLRPRVIVLLLILLTLLAYLPVLQGDFLTFDDDTYITDNNAIQHGVTVASLRWAFTSFYASNWHPMTWISYMLDYQLFRLNPAGHHFINILFHCANAGLLFYLLLYLTKELWASVFVAALFAWHPLHVESVAWIAELKDVTSTFWGLLAMLAYVHYVKILSLHTETAATGVIVHQNPGRFAQRPACYYWGSVMLYALSLMSKSMLVTLPFLLLLLDCWPLQRVKNLGRCLVEKLPFLILAAGVSCLTVMAQRNTAMASFSAVPFHLRLENVLVAYASYLWKAVWPANLAILYPLPDQIRLLKLVFSAMSIAAISIITVLAGRRKPWLPVGWLWYLGTLVPVIGLVQVGSQAMADRYTYFPLIGIFFAITLSVVSVARHHQINQAWLAIPSILLLASCLIQTEYQLRYWRNTETLFTHALNLTANNPLAHLVLGQAYEQSQQSDKAMAEYLEAKKLSSGQPRIYQSIGRLLGVEGQLEEALQYYQMAVKLNSQSSVLHDSIGAILIQLKRYENAEKELLEAIRLDPTYAPAHFRMGWLLLGNDQGADALKQFRIAVQLEPNNVERIIYVARVLAAADNPQVRDGIEACKLAQRAKELAGGNQPGVWDTLAAAYAECGRFDEAVAAEQQALSLVPQVSSHEEMQDLRDRLELYQKHQPWRKSFAPSWSSKKSPNKLEQKN